MISQEGRVIAFVMLEGHEEIRADRVWGRAARCSMNAVRLLVSAYDARDNAGRLWQGLGYYPPKRDSGILLKGWTCTNPECRVFNGEEKKNVQNVGLVPLQNMTYSAWMTWLKTYFQANGLQILTAVLSAVDAWALATHPTWMPYCIAAGTVLGTAGIHLKPMVWTTSAIQARLLSQAVSATEPPAAS